MSAAQHDFIAALRERLGPKGVVTDEGDIAPWLIDWRGKFRGLSRAMLAPASTDEVAFIVSLAAEHRVALVPQGGNTSMCGGATPPDDGSAVLLSLRRMNSIRSISAADRQAVTEAGVILSDLHDRVADVGCRFPLTLGAKGSATIGGLIATNAGGTQVLRFGTMRSLVAGLEAVMPNGAIHNGLSALKKDNRGYNLDQLLVGSEGTIGIVTAATLRLELAVAARTTVWAGVSSPGQALDLLRFLEGRVSGVEGFEIVPRDTLGLVLQHIPNSRSPLEGDHAWHVLIEATTSGDGEVLRSLMEDALSNAHEAGHLSDATIAANEAQAEAFWRLRDSIAEAERAHGASIAHDISVAVSEMPSFIDEAGAEVERRFPQTRVDAFGHLGDGNVHFHVRSLDGPWQAEKAQQVSALVYELVSKAGGSVSAEHGIGQLKIGEFERLTDPARVAAVQAIKRALDPLNIMNPGKLVRS
jgi:FAD/FMN-containing dehydrogenase